MTYQCAVCKLEFLSQELAQQCEEWCRTHESCNLEIGRRAVNRDSAGCCDERFNVRTKGHTRLSRAGSES